MSRRSRRGAKRGPLPVRSVTVRNPGVVGLERVLVFAGHVEIRCRQKRPHCTSMLGDERGSTVLEVLMQPDGAPPPASAADLTVITLRLPEGWVAFSQAGKWGCVVYAYPQRDQLGRVAWEAPR
jgi:hypothetical protein